MKKKKHVIVQIRKTKTDLVGNNSSNSNLGNGNIKSLVVDVDVEVVESGGSVLS